MKPSLSQWWYQDCIKTDLKNLFKVTLTPVIKTVAQWGLWRLLLIIRDSKVNSVLHTCTLLFCLKWESSQTNSRPLLDKKGNWQYSKIINSTTKCSNIRMSELLTTVTLVAVLYIHLLYRHKTYLLVKSSSPLQCVSDIRRQVPWFLGAAP